MTNFKKIFLFLIISIVAITSLYACVKDIKLTYYVDGKVYKEVVLDKKKEIQLPEEPKKEGYNFIGWFLKNDNKTQFTKNSKVNKSTELDGIFKPIMITRVISGKEEKVELLKLDENLPSKDGLILDKWYIDPEFKTLYNKQNTDKLYARFAGLLTYHNGYETLKEVKVPFNEKTKAPSIDEIIKPYMAKENIEFLDENGNAFDFNQAITKSLTIEVKWHSPYLKYSQNKVTGKYFISEYDQDNGGNEFWDKNKQPAVRFPAKFVKDGNTYEIEGVDGFSFWGRAKTFIFDEGIKHIQNFIGSTYFQMDKIVLPKSLRVIDNCFNGLKIAKDIVIPEGVEQIINSFWEQAYGDYGDSYIEYPFTIKLPKTVKSMSNVPSNIEVEGNSDYYRESKDGNNYLYHKEADGTLTLVSATTTGDTIKVQEGVNNIHVGFYSHNPKVKFVMLPSTFKKVIYNGLLKEYNYYRGYALLDDSDTPYGGYTHVEGYSIISTLEKLNRVIFNQESYPSNMDVAAISGKSEGEYTDFNSFDNKVVYTKKIDNGKPLNVFVNTFNLDSGEVNQTNNGETFVYRSVYKSGDKLDMNRLLEDLKLNNDKKYLIKSYKKFDSIFNPEEKLDSHLYLDVYYSFKPAGFKYEVDANNNAVINGYDGKTAILNENTNLYTVAIPSKIDGKDVVKIADDAFKDVEEIEDVVIPASVKEIGSRAFYGAKNLKRVTIASGQLEKIGRSAFENSGLTEITLSLKNLKQIEPYAFKNPTLRGFNVAQGEEVLEFGQFSFSGEINYYPKKALVGRFFLYRHGEDDKPFYQILHLKSVQKMKVKAKEEDTEPTVEVNVYDMQLVAVAGGYKDSFAPNLGTSLRSSSILSAPQLPENVKEHFSKNIVRLEIMEGSVYYLERDVSEESTLLIGIIKKIHKNAFTDMKMVNQIGGSSSYEKVGKVIVDSDGKKVTNGIFRYARGKTGSNNVYEEYVSRADLKNKEIFEEGWWEGLTGQEFDEFTEGIQEMDTLLY